ncbi:GNAT family N-acetyltransferase [Paenibacillus sp. NPDC057934]|uniref:GNAT family N-acetyltransferase n=1 Tax=Paenibacillus sp. NPDC057934 TaxID=3346282 RepID=UPI0036DC6BD5
MITLEVVSEPMSPENIGIQTSMMNSQPSYNLVVMGKASLTNEEILEENTDIHKDYEGQGIGRQVVELIECNLREENVDKVRLCVQKGNESGALFWSKNEYIIISSSMDHRGNPIDIYEKKL